MSNLQVHFTAESQNSKIGTIPCTMTERSSCPEICPLLNNGCYANLGPSRWNWTNLDQRKIGGSWSAMVFEIDQLEESQIWRHNTTGDLPHINQKIIKARVRELVDANRGKRGFTYTHHSPHNPHNADIIKESNRSGFTINLSANSPRHADELLALGIGPVVTMVPSTQVTNTATPSGANVVICPAVNRVGVTCKSCGLCQRVNRTAVIGFPAHGVKKKTVNQIIKLSNISR